MWKALAVVGTAAGLVVAAELPASAADPIAVSVESAHLGPGTTDVTLSGEVTCSPPFSVATIGGTLMQRQGRLAVHDIFVTQVQCSDSPTTWTATTSGGSSTVSSGRTFLPKLATVSLTASPCQLVDNSFFVCGTPVTIEPNIKIRNH